MMLMGCACTARAVYRLKIKLCFNACGAAVKVRQCRRGKLVGKTDRKAGDRQYFILAMHKNFDASVLSVRLLDKQHDSPRIFDTQLASVMLGFGATLSSDEVRLALTSASSDVPLPAPKNCCQARLDGFSNSDGDADAAPKTATAAKAAATAGANQEGG
jgi:hypothetical protein